MFKNNHNILTRKKNSKLIEHIFDFIPRKAQKHHLNVTTTITCNHYYKIKFVQQSKILMWGKLNSVLLLTVIISISFEE